MKSIEEVVKNKKKNFLVKKRNVPILNENDLTDFDACTHLMYNIDGLNIKNSDELLERLTPFFTIYLVLTEEKTGIVNY